MKKINFLLMLEPEPELAKSCYGKSRLSRWDRHNIKPMGQTQYATYLRRDSQIVLHTPQAELH